jgi:hypothetical protein
MRLRACIVSYWLVLIVTPAVGAWFLTRSFHVALAVLILLALGLPRFPSVHRFWQRLWGIKPSEEDYEPGI